MGVGKCCGLEALHRVAHTRCNHLPAPSSIFIVSGRRFPGNPKSFHSKVFRRKAMARLALSSAKEVELH